MTTNREILTNARLYFLVVLYPVPQYDLLAANIIEDARAGVTENSGHFSPR
jgi:hypothetical protein